MKTAIIIKGNPKFIENNKVAEKFYCDLKLFLESLNYQVSFDSGEPYTAPPVADLWVGHSRGNDRLRFAPKEILTIHISSIGGINHLKDKSLEKDQEPDEFHFILTKEMKSEIIKKINHLSSSH